MADDFGLNIVCEAPIVSSGNNLKKKRKTNKYERRRERSRKSKVQQNSKKSNIASSPDVENDFPDKVVQPVPLDQKEEEVEIEGEEEEEEEENDEEDCIDQKPKLGPLVAQENPTRLSSTKSNAISLNTMESSQESSVVPQTRKHHNMENEEERASYMAEFHARPMEMDRRAGASGKYTQSTESQHLFETHKQLPLHPKLWQQCQTIFGMKKPTQIQISTWEQFFSNFAMNNLFVQSETGSGKTLAYLLPIVQSLVIDPNNERELIKKSRESGGTVCLILCPTRELASQTLTAVESLTRGTWLVSGCLSGGEKRKSEKARLRRGISILVATPGRLLDHLQKTEALLLSLKGKLQFVVLDESDRLLDMGLGGQIEQIIQRIRANQPGSGRNGITWRALLVSATVSLKEKELAKTLLGGENWVWARGGGSGESYNLLVESTPRQLSHVHITVTAKLKLATLVAFLAQRVALCERIVVFMSTCDGVDYHCALFNAMDSILPSKSEKDENHSGIFGRDCPIFKLHGSVLHADRQTVLQRFNTCKTALLLATDVAARGLNLSRVDWIVQYDPPCEIAEYAHRAGRAARAGEAGHALLFLLPSERQFLEMLELRGVKKMDALSVAHTLTAAAEICHELTAESRAGLKNKGEAFAAEIQRRFEDVVLQDDVDTKARFKPIPRTKGQKRPPEPCGVLLEMARKAFFAFVRAYPTKEKIVRHIFNARALHVGHIARSFALKEPPKSSINKLSQSSNEQKDTGEKRNSTLAFQMVLEEKGFEQKKRHRVSEVTTKASMIRQDGSIDTAKARVLLMERAAKLQQEGMSSL